MNNVNVNLAFTADTSQARAQLQSLQQSLNNITNSTKIGGTGPLAVTQRIQEGIQAATALQIHLKNATNVDTGTLSFTKLNQSLQQSGASLQTYAAQLKNMGPEGTQAFNQLSQAVMKSEMPIRRSSKLLKDMGRTLGSTIRWQLSSSLIHGFVSALSKAYNYAQDLNESLNNIRIVTGSSSEEMEKFAKEANKAAKALSTTTNEYAKASLIYYQQGLSSDEVLKRTNVTIKMANVTKQSAEETSDQLTAIWNNFYDGTKSLEYYADVLTKLGAATASSSDEIAGGLEKFAAIGDTIGLSYEYAASALATITARTRQSEDVVGTALKTIFGRMQGLKLGETLEDDVDLNKYTEALASIGVNVLDQNKQLRNMDDILNDLGDKWGQLSKAQQVATAYTVGGMRQYNQLISLMDNWDFMKENIEMAKNSTGELANQSKIYEEGWEAASNRVQAALEELYTKFIDDDFFISFLDGLKEVIEYVSQTIDAFGGLKGVLLTIGAIVTRVFSQSIATGLTSLVSNIALMLPGGEKRAQAARAAEIKGMVGTMRGDGKNVANNIRADNMERELNLQQQLADKAKDMTTFELELNKAHLERLHKLGEERVLLQEQSELLENQARQANSSVGALISQNMTTTGQEARQAEAKARNDAADAQMNVFDAEANYEIAQQQAFAEIQQGELTEQTLKELSNAFENLRQVASDAGIEIDESLTITDDVAEAKQNLEQFKQQLSDTGVAAAQAGSQAEENLTNVMAPEGTSRQRRAQARDVAENVRSTKKKQAFNKRDTENIDGAIEKTGKIAKKSIDDSKGYTKSWSTGFTTVASSAMSLGMAFQSLSGIMDTIKNPDMSGWEKFFAILTSGGMAVLMLMPTLTQLGTAYMGLMPKIQMAAASLNAEALARLKLKQLTDEEIASLTLEQLIKKTGLADEKAEIALKALKISSLGQERLATSALSDEKKKEFLIKKTGMSADQAEIVLSKLKEGATMKEALAAAFKTKTDSAETTGIWAKVKAKIAELAVSTPLLIITIAITAAIAALVAIIWIFVAASQAKTKALEENAKRTKEHADKMKELKEGTDSTADSTKELINTLKQQILAGEDITNTYSELTTKLNEVAQKYKEMGISETTLELMKQGAELGLATGQWEDYTEALRAAKGEAEMAVGKSAASSVTAATEKVANISISYEDSMISDPFGSKGVFQSEDDYIKQVDAGFKNILNSEKYKKLFEEVGVLTTDVAAMEGDMSTYEYAGEVKLDTSNTFAFIKDYEALLDLYNTLTLQGYESAATEAKTILDKYTEDYNNIIEKLPEAETYYMQNALNELGYADPSNIQNIQQYTTYISEMSEKLKETYGSAELAAEGVQKYLNSFSNTSKIARQYSAMQKIYRRFQQGTAKRSGNAIIENDAYTLTTEGQKQLKQQYGEFEKWFYNLSTLDQDLLVDINLQYIENLKELQNALDEMREFDIKVNFDYKDSLAELKNADTTRSGLSGIMEAYKEKGYLTTSEAIEFINENPDQAGYLIKSGNQYKVTTAAIKKFNGALNDAEDAIDDLISKENLGKQEAYEFGQSLVGIKNIWESEDWKGLFNDRESQRRNGGSSIRPINTIIDKIQELNINFANGKIKYTEYFEGLQEQIDKIDLSKLSSENLMAFTDKLMPTLLRGISSQLSAYNNAFKTGQIGSKEYRDAYVQAGKTALETIEKSKQAALQKINQLTGKNYNEKNLWIFTEVDKAANSKDAKEQEAAKLMKRYTSLIQASQETTEILTAAEAFDPILDATSDYYDTLNKIFDNDWTLKINVDALDTTSAKLEAWGKKVSGTYQNLNEQQQESIKKAINDFNQNTLATSEYTQEQIQKDAIESLSNVEYFNGLSAQRQAAVMQQISRSGAETTSALGTKISNVFKALSNYLNNFGGTITITPPKEGFITALKSGKEFSVDVSTSGFGATGYRSTGAWNDEAGAYEMEEYDLLDDVVAAFTEIMDTNADSIDFFKPEDVVGTPGDINLDDTDDGDDKDDKDKTSKDDIVERYIEINRALERQEKIVSNLEDQYDRLYGKDRIAAQEAIIKASEKEIALLKEKRQLNAAFRLADQKALEKMVAEFGFELQFDTAGNITNETAILSSLFDKVETLENSGGDSEKLNEQIDKIKEGFEKYAEELTVFTETFEQELESTMRKAEAEMAKNTEAIEQNTKAQDKLRKKVDKTYGIDRIKGEQEYRKRLQADEADYNKQIQEQQIKDRNYIDALKALGYTFDNEHNFTNKLEQDAILEQNVKDAAQKYGVNSVQWNSANETLFNARTLANLLGMGRTHIEELYDEKGNIQENYANSLWGEFDYVIELKGIITDIEIDKTELKEALLNDEQWGERIEITGQKFAISDQTLKDARDTLNELNQTPEALRDNTWFEKRKEAFENFSEAIKDNMTSLDEYLEQCSDAFSEIHDKAMETIDGYDQVNSTLEHYKNLVEALNGEVDYKAIDSILKATLKNTKNNLNALKTYRDTVLLPQQKKLIAEIANGSYTGDALIKAKEQLKNITDLVDETNSEINSKLEEATQIANELLENAVDSAIATFEEALTGGVRFEELTQSIERLTKKQEEFLTKTNQLYETNKLIRQAQLDMDKTDNLLAKQRYGDFIKETEQLAKQEKMSQQDLKIAQARYQLLQAQIALEEAQKAKNSMRLVRNASGNWDYIYTADQSKISDAEGKVADAENSLYNLGLDGAQQYRDKIIELDKEFNEKAKEINLKYKDDEEKRQAALEELLNHHLTVRANLEKEYYKAYNLLVAESSTGYADYMLGNIASTKEFEKSALTLFDNLDSATGDWEINTKDATQEVYNNYNTLDKKMNNVLLTSDNISDQLDILIPKLSDEARIVGEDAKNWLELYNAKKKALELAVNEVNSVGSDIQKDAGEQSENINKAHNTKTNSNAASSIDWSSEMLKALMGKSSYTYSQAYQERENKVKETGNNYGYTTKQINDILYHASSNNYLSELEGKTIKEWYKIAKGKGFAAFDTGGYTGAWGPQGKFAMLHEKELVLNAHDTENILESVGLVRELSDFLEGQTLAQQYALGLKAMITQRDLDKEMLQQEVTIHANFPNVSSRKEIEDAFSNLVNEAAQYANEKRLRGF